MAIESFLIILQTLISLNTPSEAQSQQKQPRVEIEKTVMPQAPLARGGWDRN